MSNKSVIIERDFDADIKLVWRALTEKDIMKQWYIDVEEFKPVVGFKFTFWGGEPGDKKWKHLCEITEVVSGKKLSYSWKYEGYTGISHLTIELFKIDTGTKLKLTHSGIDSFPPDVLDLASTNFEKGWKELINVSLKEYLER